MILRTATLLVIGCGAVVPAQAQIAGEVREPSGEPIPGVLVELWTPNGRGAVGVTDEHGSFSFSEAQARGVTGGSFSRIGFSSAAQMMESIENSLVVTLEPVAVPLPELVVNAATEVCPNVEDAEARSVWERTASRYSRDTAARGVAMRVLRREEALVPLTRIGLIEEDRLRYADMRRVGATREPEFGRYRNINSRIAATGYVMSTGLDRPQWEFRELEGRHAHHFASEVFGERHTLSVHGESESTITLSFCPRGERGSGMEGVLTVSHDTSFVSSRWSYGAPDGSQEAGGEVLFVPWWGESDDLPHLLAARGVFWRQEPTSSDRFFQRTSVFTDWNISLDIEMPALP